MIGDRTPLHTGQFSGTAVSLNCHPPAVGLKIPRPARRRVTPLLFSAAGRGTPPRFVLTLNVFGLMSVVRRVVRRTAGVMADWNGRTVSSIEPYSPSESRGGAFADVVGWPEDLGVDSKLRRCQEIIGYRFRDQSLLLSALTHASGAVRRLESNERLEFLGDAVLGLTVCQWLFEEYPEYDEGDLTKIKSSVVSRRSCARVACRLQLDQCLIVGRGVTRSRSFPKSLVSDVFEAIVAALYLDGGPEVVRDRLKNWLAEEVGHAVETQGSSNFKSALQQFAQRELSDTPVYRLVRESGPDHRKSFLMAAAIGDRTFSPAWGTNKKDAEQRSAANALAELHEQPPPYPLDPDG